MELWIFDGDEDILDGGNLEDWFKSNLTPDRCIKECLKMHYSLAGVLFGNSCCCGNFPLSENKIVDQKECNFNCPGKTIKCGGDQKANVFETEGKIFYSNY